MLARVRWEKWHYENQASVQKCHYGTLLQCVSDGKRIWGIVARDEDRGLDNIEISELKLVSWFQWMNNGEKPWPNMTGSDPSQSDT